MISAGIFIASIVALVILDKPNPRHRQ